MTRRLKSYVLSDKMSFGKYKNNTVKEVFDIEPAYIIWAIENVNFFCLKNLSEFRNHFITKKEAFKKKYGNTVISVLSDFENDVIIWLELIEAIGKVEILNETKLKSIASKTHSRTEYVSDNNYYYNNGVEREFEWGGLQGEEAVAGYWNTQ